MNGILFPECVKISCSVSAHDSIQKAETLKTTEWNGNQSDGKLTENNFRGNMFRQVYLENTTADGRT